MELTVFSKILVQVILKLSSNGAAIVLEKSNGEPMVRGYTDGAVELFHDNSKKLETTSDGVTVTGDFSIDDKIVHTGDTDTAIRFSGADTIKLETGGSERLRVDSTGDTIVSGTLFADSDLFMVDQLRHTGDTDTKIRFPAADTVTVETAGSERVRITGIGSVGINAVNPNALLEVRGTAGTYTNGITVFSGNTTHSGSNAKKWDSTSQFW